MMDIPPCGAYCETCVAYGKDCKGCVTTRGKPYYVTEEESVCPVWKCTSDRKIEHCGLCQEFPCKTFLDWYSPRRGIITVLRRAGLLVLRKKIGNEEWVKWIKDKNIEFGK